MSTIASLISQIDPSAIRPWDEAQRSVTQTQTGLLTLADLKAKQQAEQAFLLSVKNDPRVQAALFGGSTLGSLPTTGAPASGPPAAGPLPQQTTMPGQPPGAPQVVPGGQDLSQFATQGAPTPTLATIGPQGGMPGPPQPPQNPALEMARTNPRAALMLYEQQTKMQTSRLDMGAKVAGGIARIVQSVTDQASLDNARQEVAMIDPKAAAQLPQFFSKEALEPFIKRAFTVQESAELRLKTWHEQTEERKNQLKEMEIGIQLTNAGYQGLGTDVTSILRGLTDEQVKQFGGRTTPAAVAYATEQGRKLAGMSDAVKTELAIMKVNPIDAKPEQLAQAQTNIQDRELGRVRETEIQRGKTEAELRGNKTLSETMGTKATNLFDTRTMDPVDTRMKQRDYEALPAGQVRELSPQLTEQITNIRTSVPIIAQLQTHIDKIYGPGGVLERMTPDERADLAAVPGRWAKQYAQKYPEVAQAQRFIESNAGGLARALAGEKGAMAEGDVGRAKAMLPNLETTLKVWPPAEIGIQSPDTRAVALGSMNSIVDMINGRVRTILGNEQFTHPKLHRYETAQEVQAAGGDPKTQPTLPLPERPIPPQVGPNPNLKPLPPTFGPGDPTQQLKPRPPAPPVTPSTTGRDYQRLMRPPPPGPQSQAQPGRRGVELARASGMKVMDMVDVEQAMEETGKSRAEVLEAARAKGYTVYGAAASSALA